MHRLVSVAACAALLSGCAALDLKRSVPSDELAKTKKIGVVASFTDEFHGKHLGLTVFNNERFEAKVPEWQINQFATEKAVELLKGNNRFEVVPLEITGFDLDKRTPPEAQQKLWEVAKRQGVDLVVMLRPGVSDNFLHFPPGYGLFNQFGNSCVYAAYVVNTFSVTTQKSTGWEWGGEMPCARGSAKDNPFTKDILFKKEFADYSPQERALMRQRLEARIADSLGYAFGKLDLIPAGAVR